MPEAATLKSGARYQLEKPLFADDIYIDEGETIEYGGMPNEAMKPLNDEARHNLAIFYKQNGGRTPPVGDMMEKAMRERPREGAVTRIGAEPIVPLTGTVAAEGLPRPASKEPTVKHLPKTEEPRVVRPVSSQSAPVDEVPGKGSI